MGILGKMRKMVSAAPVLAGSSEINAARAKNTAERAAYVEGGRKATGRKGNATAKRLASEKNSIDTTQAQFDDFTGGNMMNFEENTRRRK